MKRNGRALAESLTLHGLLVGGMLLMAGALTPPPPTIRLDFSMLQPAPVPTPAAAPQEPSVAAAPAPPETAPPPPAPQPEPAALPQKLEPAAAKVKHTVHPITPRPQSQEQSQPQAAETPAAPTTSASVATVTGAAAIQAPAVPADEEYRRANFGAIRDSILGKIHYPMLARRRGWSGQMEISFTITPDGNIHELRVLTSTGYSLLDDEALTAIRQTAPFTPPPQAATVLTMPITFRLN